MKILIILSNFISKSSCQVSTGADNVEFGYLPRGCLNSAQQSLAPFLSWVVFLLLTLWKDKGIRVRNRRYRCLNLKYLDDSVSAAQRVAMKRVPTTGCSVSCVDNSYNLTTLSTKMFSALRRSFSVIMCTQKISFPCSCQTDFNVQIRLVPFRDGK